LQRNGVTLPRVRLAPSLPRQEYPGPQARASNRLHQVDLVGSVYLKGSGRRYYIWVGKDAFDGAICLRLAGSRRMDEVLGFLGECWKDLGRPAQAQLDNARELCGWGPAARYPRNSAMRCRSAQGRLWRGLLAGIMTGSVAVAGGCGSWESGSQVEPTKEQMELRAKAKKAISAGKKQANAERMKGQMQPQKKGRARGGP
jgi:hypothetical protein